MTFVADESCSYWVVKALRDAGFHVHYIRESSPGVADPEVLRIAREKGGVLLTEDKDFGQLVRSSGKNHGVLLIRAPESSREWVVTTLLQMVARHGSALERGFMVVQAGRVRFTRFD